MNQERARRFSLETSPRLSAVLMAVLVVTLALVVSFYASDDPDFFYAADFNMFHAAGEVAWQSRLADAYVVGALRPEDVVGTPDHPNPMLFSYPPQFGLIIWPLGALPRAWAYGLFTGGTLALYLYVLAVLAGQRFPAVLLASMPVSVLTILNGQTSFLVAGLAGLYAMATLAGRASAGVPLALLAVKPHLALGLGVAALAGRQWRAIGVALLVTLALAAVCTLAFGAGIWAAFLEATASAGDRLAEGRFKLYRMASVYVLAVTLGAPETLALALHALGALVAMAATAWAAWRWGPDRRTLGIAAVATLAVSPYVYEYDLTLLFLGLALLWGELVERARAWERATIIVLSWLSAFHVYVGIVREPVPVDAREGVVAMAALAYVVIAALLARVLSRPKRLA